MLLWSNSLLVGFECKHLIRHYTSHGEDGWVDLCAAIANDMAAICVIIYQYQSEDILNFDETALY
jgi:hypothetical protein